MEQLQVSHHSAGYLLLLMQSLAQAELSAGAGSKKKLLT